MTDFIFNQDEINGGFGQEEIDKVWNYAQFLKQPLKLGMFVPCDEDGNVLEEPVYSEPTSENEIGDLDELVYQYNLSKNSVYFEGFQFYNEGHLGNGIFTFNNDFIECKKKVEKMVKFKLKLTKSISEILGL